MTRAGEAIKEAREHGGRVPPEPAEDTLVGAEIQRHGLGARALHWLVALALVLCVGTGMPIWYPVFGWMAHLFGGLQVCRWLHPWFGVLFFAAFAAMFARWARQMLLEPQEWAWLGPKTLEYLRFDKVDPEVGRYNGGQKLYFWASALAALGLLVSGVVLWWPEEFPMWLRRTSGPLHDLAFVLFFVLLVAHVYLGTAAEPGTFRSIVNGRVTRAWAKLHHARWYREITGDKE